MAAEECTATSTTPHSWWDFHPANSSLSSWLHHHQNPTNSAANCDQDDVSISTSLTNASNHSGLTVESSAGGHQLVDQPAVVPPPSNDFIGEHASDNHLWSNVLSSVRSNGDLRNGPDTGENLFEVISSKSTSAGLIFEPTWDYLKKIEHGNWEFRNSSVFNNFINGLNGYDTSINDHDHQSSIDADQRITKLSKLIGNWSIAPPDSQINPQFNAKSCHDHISLTSNSEENYRQQLPTFCGMAEIKNPVFISCYGNGNHRHEVKTEAESLDMEAPTSYIRKAFKGSNSNGYRHHSSLANNSPMSMEADNNSPCTSTIAYSRLNKPLVDIHASSKPSFRPLASSDCKKRGLQAANSLQNKQMQTRNSNGRTQGITNEEKKKRGEETFETATVLKKAKHENSMASSVKTHAPKVKLGDRITALQQIVSPFGKTDTASVLLEAIGCINFLQGQVQLLSNPYLKLNPQKDPWGSLDGKEQKGEMEANLRSRGLCLVPISYTPKVYHENNGSDYWTPTYRGCLYR